MRAASPSMIQSLAIVRDAVREALQAAAQALAAGGDQAAAAAQRHWRSAHAAMQVVNHRALMQFSTELGALIPLADTAPAFAAGSDAFAAYMNVLIAGRGDQPMHLWPAYEAMQRARGVEEPNQSELFFPDLNAGPDDNPAAIPLNADELRGVRRVLEAGLLQWLRKGDIAGLRQVADAVTRVEGSLNSGTERQLWWIARGVLEAVEQGGLEADVLVRRLVTQLNLQLGRLLQWPAQVPKALLRDALYLAARAQPRPGTPLLNEVQRVCGLQGALNIEGAAVAGGFSVEAVTQARQRAEGLQGLWSSCVAGTGGFAVFEQRARALANACEALGEPALTALVVQLAEAAGSFTPSGAKPHDAAALEGACALLLLEQALAGDHAPGTDFEARARNMAARVKVSVEAPQALGALPPAQLLDDQARQQQSVQLTALVHAEIGRALRDIELTLDGWFRDTRNPGAIAGLDKLLRQAAGALGVLGHAEAAALAVQCRADMANYAQGASCGEAEQRALAGRLTALSAFVDAAQQDSPQLAHVLRAAALSHAPAPAMDTPAEDTPAALSATEFAAVETPRAAAPTLDAMTDASVGIPAVSTTPMVEPVAALPPALKPRQPEQQEQPAHDADGKPLSLSSSKDDDGGIERRQYRLKDDIDPQLLQIFLEEAAELVPQVGQDLRDWRARPDDTLVPQSLKRLLHTLKGSSRMAGAMALGQLTHSMESRIENAQLLPAIPDHLFDDLETSFDRIGTLIARLQGEESAVPAFEAAPMTHAMEEMARTMRMAAASGDMTQSIPMPSAAIAGAAAGQAVAAVQRPLIRVRADLIDRMANQAGEVSIARARIAAALRSARDTLRDLTENIGRLRAELRELEIQAETQVQSGFSPRPEHAGGKFDPLEFDRFTRLQELTRLMAETVNDVATVQHSLARDLDEGEKALALQAQITRDVQQDLMAIRMVPFSSISDRLFRVARLSAKDNGKRVELDISGGHVEVDRSVIERIAAPIEHLLRNAIVHGVEAPSRRVEAGKPEAGALRIEVRQEGNEVVFTLADDGAGLDIERIRDKAISLGLMRESERLTDLQIGNFIFRSGFSTAGVVTADAGRGVGMDVVMSEITALSGRVGTRFQRGKGTTFTIHLPLRLSVLQAVVMRLGGRFYAVPTMMVEQVRRLKTDVLSAAHDAQVIEWQGRRYPFHHLATLLDAGTDAAGEGAPLYGSVVLLHSGASRAAIEVDDIVGSQEIVIRNTGAQPAHVPGITGAAVLGSGETVLILNPVALSLQRMESAAHVTDSDPAAPVAAPAKQASPEPERQRSVLVVDDSLTVRKITGRLLTREGYIVLVAKDGIEALEKMRDQVPDVMITDVEMPRMDGFDLTRSVRAEESLKGLPIIMITSRTAEKHRQHATELGVEVFLGKPYEESVLLEHIARLARRPVVA